MQNSVIPTEASEHSPHSVIPTEASERERSGGTCFFDAGAPSLLSRSLRKRMGILNPN
jgi:hypothetical protein